MKVIFTAISKCKCFLKPRYCTKRFALQFSSEDRVVILCPGQGAQYVGMLQNLSPDIEERAREVTSEILAYDLVKVCRNGPREVLDRTLFCQPAIVVASILGYYTLKGRMKKEQNMKEFNIGYGAGYSVGEISALCIANWITFKEALYVIKARATAMDKASSMSPTGMISIQGLTFDEAKQMCEDLTTRANNPKNRISVAIEQYPKSVALGGSHNMLNKVINREHVLIQSTSHVKISTLPVSGAFHTSYMKPAQEKFHNALSSINITRSDTTLYSNVTGDCYRKEDNVTDLLVRQITEPVLWNSILNKLHRDYVSGVVQNIYEVGTGRQLKFMFGKIDSRLLKIIRNVEM
ncbi:malonyl-CoA-acyl carrier protein transacylase, mitochondrial-like [Hydractinia symbiolongicarpus]|uniref:malonyl-CoA-acyl carrier protein transacylase, mitochondrial-like n=1 Tax=Hydractinia symbiolongicarpus TaxID=13093 RepID=UPI00254D1622|nr:malonyl-CoA-acyl carrier protein transacylase, mitochondrial-like [Hydractinia symbiolongicarpus]